jgi:ribosomal protein L14E/L6E/L27E
MVSERDGQIEKEQVLIIGPSKLAKQPNNRKTVAHIIKIP